MSDYDAFGRKKDDAGLGDLGWGTSDSPTAPPQPAETPVPATPQASELTSTAPPSAALGRRRGRNPVVALVQFAVLAAIIFGIYSTVTAGGEAVDQARGVIDALDDGVGQATTTTDEDDSVPERVEARALFKPRGLSSALELLEQEVPGKVSNLAIRRDRIDIQVFRAGNLRFVSLAADAEAPTIHTTQTGVALPAYPLSYEEINPTAPARLIRAAGARLGKAPSQVDYLVAQKFTGTVQWGVYYKDGAIAQGDSRGRYVRRIS